MIGERTLEGWVVRLKPRGIGRFFTAAFLAFWLCGWAAGEAFALWFLIKGGYALLTGTPPEAGRAPLELAPALAAGVFLIFWLTLWTVGGIAAMAALFTQLWAEDRLIVHGTGLTVRRSRGPFRSRREYPRERLRGVAMLPGRGTLILETERERVELSALGTREEREAAAEALRSELALPAAPPGETPLPKGWQETITPEGERAVVPDAGLRKVQARVALTLMLGLSVVAFVILREAVTQPALIPFAVMTCAVTALLGWGVAWLRYGRTELRIGAGAVTIRRRFRSRVRDLLEARRLDLTVRFDSDSDPWFELEGVSQAEDDSAVPDHFTLKPAKNRRTIVSVIHDPTVPRLLGAWLARNAGVPLRDRTTPAEREADVTITLAKLDEAGPLGRVAAGWIRKAQERRRKSA